MKRLILLAFIAACLPVTAADSDVHAFSLTLAAGEVHEECMHMKLNDWGKYEWKSDEPVDFNIHYHRGSDVVFPVQRDGMRGDGGTFTAKTAEDYCWMWTARDAAAKIEGRIEK